MLPRVIVLFGWSLAGPLLVAACGDASAPSNASPGTPTGIHAYEPDAGDAGGPDNEPEVSIGAQPAVTYQGSPLCQASRATGCYPDDMINACDFVPGAGSMDAEADANVNVAPACHVVADGLAVHTTCLPSTVAGMYASTCSRSTECSPGYECVSGGTCRHYCCSGNSACSENQFCDVQPVAESPSTPVPVCLAQIPCVLLDDDTCPPDEQCSVVRDNGATSCVDLGTAQDGDPCDRAHCARGLVCLGALGLRRCEPLCYTAYQAQCKATNRTCVGTLPLFPNPTVGVCQ
jgi:hypothetical protein